MDHGTCGLAVPWERARLDKTSLSSSVARAQDQSPSPNWPFPSSLPLRAREPAASDGRGFTVLRRGFRPSSRSLRNGGNLFSLARACAEASLRESRGCNCAGCARACIFHGVGPRPSFGLLTILAAKRGTGRGEKWEQSRWPELQDRWPGAGETLHGRR